jgi:dihydroorotate dehydrogenase (fumarate)
VTDLTTMYLGLKLHSPFVASPGPVTGDPAMWARLEAAGAGAIVLPSLFEEQIEHGRRRQCAWETAPTATKALSYLRTSTAWRSDRPPSRSRRARRRRIDPGHRQHQRRVAGGWVRYAKLLAEAGAGTIELNRTTPSPIR